MKLPLPHQWLIVMFTALSCGFPIPLLCWGQVAPLGSRVGQDSFYQHSTLAFPAHMVLPSLWKKGCLLLTLLFIRCCHTRTSPAPEFHLWTSLRETQLQCEWPSGPSRHMPSAPSDPWAAHPPTVREKHCPSTSTSAGKEAGGRDTAQHALSRASL